jgi:hypothetical protein
VRKTSLIPRALVVGVLLTLTVGGVPASALPDGRTHELVSVAAEDNLGDVFYGVGVTDDGSGVRFGTMAALPDAGSAQLTAENIARRGPTGWAVSNANAPLIGQQPSGISSATIVGASSDMSVVVLRTYARLHPDDVDNTNEDFYRYEPATGRLDFISSGFDNAYGGDGGHYYVGASRDLSRIFFRMDGVRLDPEAQKGIYEWSNDGVRLISRRPDGTPAVDWPVPGAFAPNRSGLDGDPYGGALPHGGAHSVSDDGSRVYWNDLPGGILYLHEDGEPTRVISESRRTGSVGDAVSGQFVAASHDGSVVYFTNQDQLTDEAAPGGGLYRYDIDSDSLELVTPPAPGGAGVYLADAVVSDDSSHVYFASTAAFAPGAVDNGSDRNVYLWDGSTTRFIGAFDGATRTMRASRDGRFLLIESTASVDGAELNGHQGIYRYDAQADDLVCVSCRPSGELSQGDARIESNQYTSVPTAEFFVAPRGLSDDGRAFFSTTDRVVAGDFSSTSDAYQYGAGGPALLSSGQSDGDSFVQDNSDDGRDVFFTTDATLATRDRDGGLTDLYDARVGGGFTTAPIDRPCRDDGCQGSLGSPPDATTPGTSASGDGEAVRVRARALLASVGRAARRQFSRTGRLRVAVRVNRPGTVNVTLKGSVGGKLRTLDTARRTVRRKGVVRVTVKLPRRARAALRRSGRMRVAVGASLGASKTARLNFTLKRAER